MKNNSGNNISNNLMNNNYCIRYPNPKIPTTTHSSTTTTNHNTNLGYNQQPPPPPPPPNYYNYAAPPPPIPPAGYQHHHGTVPSYNYNNQSVTQSAPFMFNNIPPPGLPSNIHPPPIPHPQGFIQQPNRYPSSSAFQNHYQNANFRAQHFNNNLNQRPPIQASMPSQLPPPTQQYFNPYINTSHPQFVNNSSAANQPNNFNSYTNNQTKSGLNHSYSLPNLPNRSAVDSNDHNNKRRNWDANYRNNKRRSRSRSRSRSKNRDKRSRTRSRSDSRSKSRSRYRYESNDKYSSRNNGSSRYDSRKDSRDSRDYSKDSRDDKYNRNNQRYNSYNNNNNRSRYDSNRTRFDDKVSNYNSNLHRDKSREDVNQKYDKRASQIVNQQEASYVQTTLIPIYYVKDQNNPKLIKASNKLIDLCDKFEKDIIDRSRLAREKANIPEEKTAIPNYRQLLLTKKFDKFTRCTCDHPNHESQETKSNCKKHVKRRLSDKSRSSQSSCSNSSEESSDETGSDDDDDDGSQSDSSCSSTGSSNASSKNSKLNKEIDKNDKESENKKEKNNKEDKFDDIRSMEIHRKQNHPERLHPDLSFNEPDQTNEGPLCKCKLKNTKFGTRHQIYYGEKAIPTCDPYSNNSDKLYHYRMSIQPFNNFIFKHPTSIEYDKHDYNFEGYSIFSHEPIDNIPDCVVVIYNHEYKLNIVKEDMIENYTIKELELLRQFIFIEILELYDLKWKGFEVEDTACNRFHVLPRFCRTLPYNGKEILSPCEILKYFLDNNVPVINSSMIAKCHLLSNREWLNFVEPLQGSIVTYPGKRPSSIRLDQLDRDQIINKVKDESRSYKNTIYPLIIHFSMFRNTWLPLIKNNMKLKKLYHKYFKLRHLLNNKTKLTTEDKAKLRALGDELQALIRKSSEVHKEIMVELSSENFLRTGIRTDIVQQTVLVPTFVEHLRFHLSLKFLEQKIGYTFKNRLLLQHALTHPSGAFLLHQNLGCNPDHIRNCLFNCKARNPNYGVLTPQKRKSLLRKKGIHMLFSIMSQKANDNEESSSISNYERLEFLGDKILELLTSKHLFFMFPTFDEGQLSEYRNAIVQNQYLAILARKLDMHFFIIFYHGVDLCSNSALNHALANSFEALLAAIYLDSDLNTVSNMLAKTLWDEEPDLLTTWTNLRSHPIQAQLPDGDRHLIPNTKILQHVNLFEEMIGVEFKHIRLLAQAFCTRSASFNLITLGDNQRLEFLGDTVLNFVVSDYLYRFFPNHHEGHLSLLRSSLVCNSTQALLYDELGMGDFVLASYINNRQETSGNLKRKADVFEAFVGALYIDQDVDTVNVFCNVCMFNKLQDIILYQFWHDPKSRLQQCCLSLRDVDDSKPSLPTYKLIEEKGPPNHKQYRVAVYFNRKRIGEGVGKSIHDAEVEAAKHALKKNADMFPILNKYIANELKNSKYCPESLKSELNSSKKKKKNKNKKFKKQDQNVEPKNDNKNQPQCKNSNKISNSNFSSSTENFAQKEKNLKFYEENFDELNTF